MSSSRTHHLDAEQYLRGTSYRPVQPLGRGNSGEVWAVQGPSGSLAVAKLLREGDRGAKAVAHEAAMLSAVPAGVAPRLLYSRAQSVYPLLIQEHACGRQISHAENNSETVLAVLRVVSRLHKAGIAHGDLKPSHFFHERGRVQMIDFGSACGLGLHGLAEFTPGFAAPELHQGKEPSSASDVYALAAIFFWLFAKRAVFVGSEALLVEAHQSWDPPQLASIVEVEESINSLIYRGLGKTPESRPTIDEFEHAFHNMRGGRRVHKLHTQPEALAKTRLLLLAVTPRPSLDELREKAEFAGGELRAWTRDAALLSFAVASEPIRREVDTLAKLWAQQERCVVLDEQLVSTRRDRKGNLRELLDGEQTLAILVARGSLPGVHQSAAPSALALVRPSLVGRQRVLRNLESLLESRTLDPVVIELLAAPGVGASRVAEELAGRIEGCELFSGVPSQPVVIVDDAHLVSRTEMLALRGALKEGRCEAVVLVLRGGQDGTHGLKTTARVVLPALGSDDIHAIFSELLPDLKLWTHEQIEYLIRWTGGLATLVVEVAQAALRGGFVAPRAQGKAAYADLAGLDRVLNLASADWVVEQHRASLGASYGVALELCLSNRNTLAELEATRWRIPSTMPRLDLRRGLAALDAQDLLRTDSDGYVGLRSELLRRALYEKLGASHWRRHHRSRLMHWLAEPKSPARDQALAEHGAGCGRNRLAIAASHRRAQELMREGACSAAEASLDRCLELCKPDEQAEFLLTRAEARLRSDRLGAALDDASHATRISTGATKARGHLMQAMVLDWMRDYSAAANESERAAQCCDSATPASVRASLLLARGRDCWRQRDFRSARCTLLRAQLRGHGVTHRVSALLEPLATLALGQIELASEELTTAITLCERERDWLHLCAALANRSHIWSAMGNTMRSQEDLRRLVSLARLTGHTNPERVAAYNLGEDLYWMGGCDEEALLLARRAHSIYQDYEVHSTAVYALLEARVLTSMERHEDAREILSAYEVGQDPKCAALAQALVSYLEGSAPSTLDDESLLPEVRLEAGYWKARAALGQGLLAQARELARAARAVLSAAPLFESRLDSLDELLA